MESGKGSFCVMLQMGMCFQKGAYATKSRETVESWTSVYGVEVCKVSSLQDFPALLTSLMCCKELVTYEPLNMQNVEYM